MIQEIWKAMTKILKLIGSVQTTLLLGLFYYLVLWPFAILYQFSQTLKKPPRKPKSYWIKRPTDLQTREKLLKQY